MGSSGTPAHGRLVGGFVAVWGAVPQLDITVVHWILRRYRLYRGEHVTAVEAAVAGLRALALARGAASLRRARAAPTSRGPGARSRGLGTRTRPTFRPRR